MTAANKGASLTAKLPHTTIVICSRNRPQLLLDTVNSVLRGNERPDEMIIVDQSDAPHPILSNATKSAACSVRYLWMQRPGVARARNLAVATAGHSICVLIDDDMFVEENWFGALVRALVKAGPGSVVTGQVRSAPKGSGKSAPSLKEDAHPVVYEGRINEDVLYTGNMAIFRSTFQDVGGFDERLGPGTKYPAAEDNDFGFRLLEKGYCIHYVPEAIVYHRSWRSEREFLALKWRYGVGRGAYYAKQSSLRDRYMLARMTRDIASHLMQLVRHLRYERRRSHGDALLIAGILRGALGWWLECVLRGKLWRS